jgi:hypothetical protein
MITVNGKDINVIHVRHDGRSHEIFSDDLGITGAVDSTALFSAVEDNLDLSAGILNGYMFEIIDSSNTLTIYPQAKFGV